MKALVALANYGMKNAEHARRLVEAYRSMSFQVDIVVLCETEKYFGPDVTQIIGLPTRDPWSLPFAHRKLFIDRLSDYNLFIYTEDDVLIQEDNVWSFLRASQVLPDRMIPGFIRFEVYPDGRKQYPDIHAGCHWNPRSVGRQGEYVYAGLSNEHSACYMLTQDQLGGVIKSGGYSLIPHSGRYDMLCAAATDPYTQCGFRRVVCVSHIEKFELHHLPNAYVDRLGIDEEEFRIQLSALDRIVEGTLDDRQLFPTLKNIDTVAWDKSYYEPCREELLKHVPASAQTVLSVGCGAGETEAQLVAKGREVTGLPLDSVIGHLAQHRGIRVLPPNFGQASDLLGSERFDVVLLADILQHLKDPAKTLTGLRGRLQRGGVVVGSVPNFNFIRQLLTRALAKRSKWAMARGAFSRTGLHLTNRRLLERWLEVAGLRPVKIFGAGTASHSKRGMPSSLAAPDIVFVARAAGG